MDFFKVEEAQKSPLTSVVAGKVANGLNTSEATAQFSETDLETEKYTKQDI